MVYVLIIIIIILVMPIEVVFKKDEINNDIDIFLTKLFNLRLDFDEVLKLLLTTKENRTDITLSGLKHNYHLFMLARNLIYDVSKNTRPKELSFVFKAKKVYPELDIFIYVGLWSFLSYLKNKFHEFVPRLENDNYELVYTSNFNFSFYWSVRLRVIYIIFSIIKNYKDLFKIRKFLRKGKKDYGASSNL